MSESIQYESRYGLRVPIADEATNAKLDLRPRRIQDWLSQLPLANPDESAKRLRALLHAANRATLPHNARFKFADTLHEIVGQVSRTLVRGISHRGFPLVGNALRQAELCIGLQRALGDTYKLALADALVAGATDRKLVAASIQQGMLHLGRLLLDHYALYAPAADGLWLDLHRLYRIAEDHDLLTPAVRSRRAPAGARIGELYRQALLISLSNPYRLRRGELGRVVTLASAAAHKLIISPRPTAQATFQVRTEQDRPPFVRAHEHDTGGVRYIDLSAVVEAIEQHPSAPGPSEMRLREHLLELWRRPPRRGFRRIAQRAEIRVGVGLNTAHFLLEKELPLPEIAEHEAPALGIIPPPDSTLESLTLTEARIAYGRPWYDDGSERFYPTVSRSREHYPLPGATLPEPQYQDFPWQTVDVSARGCCLRWDSDQPSPARVGEVVTMREAEGGAWTVGVVRWMQYEQERGLRLGVEILAPGAAPVLARRTDKKPSESTQDTALELPGVSAAGQPASLLLASTEHQVGELLDVLHHGQPKRIRLTAELERNGSFTHFVYESLDDGDDCRRDTGAASMPPA